MTGEIKITHPSKCILGYTFPTTQKEFLEILQQEDKRDFIQSQYVKKHSGNHFFLWEAYSNFNSKIKKHIIEIEQTGVVVVQNFSFDDLKKIDSFDVFTLFAHWSDKQNKVELFDGLYSPNEIVNAIPKSFEGIFDLSVCRSFNLRNEIKRQFNNQTISHRNEISIIAKIILYKHIIKSLAKEELNFTECYSRHLENLSKMLLMI